MDTQDDIVESIREERNMDVASKAVDAGIAVDDLRKINRMTYLGDFLLTSIVFYSSFVLLLGTESLLLRLLFYVVAVFAIYRMAVFSHELAHMEKRFPAFSVLWNVLCGPVILCTTGYFRSHIDHHRSDSYGTGKDPEYTPFWETSYAAKVYLGVSPLVPFLMFIRSALLIPVSWVIPAYRRKREATEELASIHGSYVRAPHIRPKSRFEGAIEDITALLCLGLLVLAIYDHRYISMIVLWLSILSFGILLNSARTLCAHRYTNTQSPVPMTDQFADSITLNLPALVAFLMAPVGLKYHALHHLYPSLPYHSLGKAHERMLNAHEAVRVQYLRTFFIPERSMAASEHH
jgi:fatty acid desaturase